MSEIKVEYKVKGRRGGARVAGPGKVMGRPTEVIGTNGKMYMDYLDDETIAALKTVHSVRSVAIRMLANGGKLRTYERVVGP